jgi:hypothetical protein
MEVQGCEEIKVQVCNFISNTCSTSPLTNNTCLQNDIWRTTKIHIPLLCDVHNDVRVKSEGMLLYIMYQESPRLVKL